MLPTKDSPLQGVLICALIFMLVLIYWRETIHTEKFDKAQEALALLSADPSSTSQTSIPKPNEDLILFSFHETEGATKNLQFFIKHALYAKADFIFIINGEHTQDLSALVELPNVRIVERENRCFDLGAYHEVLTANTTLQVAYKRYMFINDSVRGPFLPSWAERTCWSDAYWDKLDERTRLAGMSWNCANGIPYPPHLQSMVLAFTNATLAMLLPNMKCYESMLDAVMNGETKLAGMITESGYDVYAMEGRFAAHSGASGKNTTAFLEWCVDTPETVTSGGNDILYSGKYEGSTLHPYETIFVKTNRAWDERDQKVIDLVTEHAELTEYSSYDHCR
ncbi:hypothetical protein CB0940_04976 [Cercospora beticola]|uniref:Uncharacterized protein n=1 Tax=Cercospora beticola TaxID=122368 RepID=A0A2G5HJ89_CERBT|nr:hypothetical protein CB0940_04976 [Cercospora beticola]PIA92599.1 hypothetical protein CB0940_04976 [Cercospora beticola]WPB02264.1 hypothetical protein RHO25_006898 [Cercospora beticola]CAK1362869.1 unnamed protein product [Cercospora beticola]